MYRIPPLLVMIKKLSYNGTTWIFIDKNDEEAVDFLSKNFRFHHLDLEDVRGAAQHPKLDVYKHYLLLITLFPRVDEINRVVAEEVDIFIERDFIITISNQPVAFFEKIFSRATHHPKFREELFNHGSGHIAYRLLKGLYVDANAPIFNNLSRALKEIEQKIFLRKERELQDLLYQLVSLRRDILELKRIIEPQKLIFKELVNAQVGFLHEEMKNYFDDVLDMISRYSAMLENYKEIVAGYYETNESMASYRTMAVVKLLTVISVAFLPLTLLAGLYGMNVVNLPLANHPHFVWGIFGFVLIFLGVIFSILKKRKWL